MNKINKIATYLILGFWMIISISCDDNDGWKAGLQPASDNLGVYFHKNNPLIFEVEANSKLGLLQDYFLVAVGRDEAKAGSALQVPIIVHSADPKLSIPQTVEFAAGSSLAELKINVKDFDFDTQCNFSIEVNEKYADPYRKYEDDEEGGSSRIDGKVQVRIVRVFSFFTKATFTPTDYSGGSKKPQFVPFEQEIHSDGEGAYKIKDFLFNGADYEFTFTLDEDNNIRPDVECGFHDNAEKRWYFYSGNSNESANRIPCYIPGENPNDYVTYIYFYTAENTTSYQDFWLDTSTKTGRMMGYSRYKVSGAGRIAFNISW